MSFIPQNQVMVQQPNQTQVFQIQQQQEQVRLAIDQLVRGINKIDCDIADLQLQRAIMSRELSKLTAAVVAT